MIFCLSLFMVTNIFCFINCSPCLSYFKFYDNGNGGEITLPKFSGVYEYRCDIQFSVKNYYINSKDCQFNILNYNGNVLKYQLLYPVTNNFVTIVSIKFNQKTLCEIPNFTSEVQGYQTLVSLYRLLTLPYIQNVPNNNQQAPTYVQQLPNNFQQENTNNNYLNTGQNVLNQINTGLANGQQEDIYIFNSDTSLLENNFQNTLTENPINYNSSVPSYPAYNQYGTTTNLPQQTINYGNNYQNFGNFNKNKPSTKSPLKPSLQNNVNKNTTSYFVPKTSKPPTTKMKTTTIPTIVTNNHFQINPEEVLVDKDSLENICGISDVSQALVVGGVKSKPAEFPWLAIIYEKDGSNLLYHCTGSLVTNQFLITAGHCLQKVDQFYQANDFLVILGKYNIQSWTENSEQRAEVKNIYLHNQFKYQTNSAIYADIGAMKLKSIIHFNIFIRPVCLWRTPASNSDSLAGSYGTTVGWSKGSNEALTVPNKVQFPVVSAQQCKTSNPNFKLFVNDKNFCAGNLDGTGPCLGDSGSGFYVKDEGTQKWYLRGIVSLALEDKTKNCDLYSYFVFTDVATVLNWINNLLEN